MCIGIPMKIKSIKGNFAEVEAGGLIHKVNIQILPKLKVGDYVIVHAGFAIQRLDPKMAAETLRMFDEIH